jgi:hypothetical protein
MKRAFLFGLGVSLIVTGIAITLLGHVAMPRWGSSAVGLISILAGGIVIWAAKRSSPSPSWLIAIFGWVLGYLSAGIFYIPFIYAFMLLGH